MDKHDHAFLYAWQMDYYILPFTGFPSEFTSRDSVHVHLLKDCFLVGIKRSRDFSQ